MNPSARPSRRLRERLRAMTGRSRRTPLSTRRCHYCPHDEVEHVTDQHERSCECPIYVSARSRVASGSFERTHRVVELAPPTRKWFEEQGIEPAEPMKRKWF